MTKAEEKALEHTGYCRNQSYEDYLRGYEQAEKDLIELAQLWRDSGYVNITTFRQFVKMKEEAK